VTQPPWLHQFRLGWTQVHPNYWICCRHWGWVNFFFPPLTSRLPIKKIYSTAQAFQTPTTYLHPTKNPKPRCHVKAKAMLQKTVLQKWCWSVAAEDNVAKAVLKQCYRSGCYKSNVAEDVAEVVLQKTLLQKITITYVASKCTSTFSFLCFFFTLVPLQRRWLQMLHSFSSYAILTRLW